MLDLFASLKARSVCSTSRVAERLRYPQIKSKRTPPFALTYHSSLIFLGERKCMLDCLLTD